MALITAFGTIRYLEKIICINAVNLDTYYLKCCYLVQGGYYRFFFIQFFSIALAQISIYVFFLEAIS